MWRGCCRSSEKAIKHNSWTTVVICRFSCFINFLRLCSLLYRAIRFTQTGFLWCHRFLQGCERAETWSPDGHHSPSGGLLPRPGPPSCVTPTPESEATADTAELSCSAPPPPSSVTHTAVFESTCVYLCLGDICSLAHVKLTPLLLFALLSSVNQTLKKTIMQPINDFYCEFFQSFYLPAITAVQVRAPASTADSTGVG